MSSHQGLSAGHPPQAELAAAQQLLLLPCPRQVSAPVNPRSPSNERDATSAQSSSEMGARGMFGQPRTPTPTCNDASKPRSAAGFSVGNQPMLGKAGSRWDTQHHATTKQNLLGHPPAPAAASPGRLRTAACPQSPGCRQWGPAPCSQRAEAGSSALMPSRHSSAATLEHPQLPTPLARPLQQPACNANEGP